MMENHLLILLKQVNRNIENTPSLPSIEMTEKILNLEKLRNFLQDEIQILEWENG